MDGLKKGDELGSLVDALDDLLGEGTVGDGRIVDGGGDLFDRRVDYDMDGWEWVTCGGF